MSSNRIIDTLLLTEGDIPLTAAKLHMTEVDLLLALDEDILSVDELATKLRSRILLQVYSGFMTVNQNLIMSIEESTTKEKIAIFQTLATILKEMLAKPNDPAKIIFESLPPEIRSAVERVSQTNAE